MELDEALAQIAEIRRGLARSERFEGYRALPTAATGALALLAGAAQALWIPDPIVAPRAYVGLWVGCAAAAAALAAGAVARHVARTGAELSRRRARSELVRVLPSLTAGALVTLAVTRVAPQATWMLPGLWQVFYALGLFASVGVLPAGLRRVAAAFMASGAVCLVLGPAALSPLAMALPFAFGQAWIALVLHLDPERRRAAA